MLSCDPSHQNAAGAKWINGEFLAAGCLNHVPLRMLSARTQCPGTHTSVGLGALGGSFDQIRDLSNSLWTRIHHFIDLSDPKMDHRIHDPARSFG